MNQFWTLVVGLIAALTGQQITTVPVPSHPAIVSDSAATASTSPTTAPASTGSARARPLAGKVIVVDPGHQLGNGRHPAQINRLVDAGFGEWKACNTSGTATNAGFPEATFTWDVAGDLTRRLKVLGARVVLTRDSNSESAWGPCVDVRGRTGNAGYAGLSKAADAKVSIHADGAGASDHGFHLIVCARSSQLAASDRLADLARADLEKAGLSPANYVGTNGLHHRTDLGTLNLSEIPTVMLEAGNMRNAGDARLLTSAAGQQQIAKALAQALTAALSQ